MAYSNVPKYRDKEDGMEQYDDKARKTDLLFGWTCYGLYALLIVWLIVGGLGLGWSKPREIADSGLFIPYILGGLVFLGLPGIQALRRAYGTRK